MPTGRWISLVSAIGIVLLAACGTTDEDADGGTQDTFVPEPDTGAADTTSPDTIEPPVTEYRFLLIKDLSDGSADGVDGADIDAVELQKADESSWVKSVSSCKLPDDTDCANTEGIVGASDAFCGDPVDLTRCFSNFETADPAPYVSLGGTVGEASGTIVVEMTEPIAEGDTLIVYELGNCAISATCEDTETVNAAAESIAVSIGTTAEGPWVDILASSTTAEHPAVTIEVPALEE